jgi:peptidyl-prolyl cis-trans isomerase B (cyclophilin B)
MRPLYAVLLVVSLFSCNLGKDTRVVLHTTMGDIHVRLYNDLPRHRDWFVQYANHADTTLFYRVWRDHLIQFGPPPERNIRAAMPDPAGKYPLCNGALAAVETSDKSIAARGTDFFIVQGNPKLSGQYTVFGQVAQGMEVVNRIAAVPHRENDRPLEDIRVGLEVVH